MNHDEQIIANQKRIIELAGSIGVWIMNESAALPAVRAKYVELQDRMLFRLKEIEIQGQEVKIASMEAILEILKTGDVIVQP